MKVKTLKFGFDIWGLLLFLLIMLPNFIWFAVPAQNDILRTESVTPVIDMIASVFQIIMIAAICFFISSDYQKPMKKGYLTGIVIAVFLYYIEWIFYYRGIASIFVILGLFLFPCTAFLIFSIAKRNVIAVAAAGIFTICHIIYGVGNFCI